MVGSGSPAEAGTPRACTKSGTSIAPAGREVCDGAHCLFVMKKVQRPDRCHARHPHLGPQAVRSHGIPLLRTKRARMGFPIFYEIQFATDAPVLRGVSWQPPGAA